MISAFVLGILVSVEATFDLGFVLGGAAGVPSGPTAAGTKGLARPP